MLPDTAASKVTAAHRYRNRQQPSTPQLWPARPGQRATGCGHPDPAGDDRLLRCLYYAALRPEETIALPLADCHLPGSGWACSGWPRPRLGPPPPGPTAAPAMNSADSSTGRTGRSGWSRSLRYGSPCSVRTTRPTATDPTAGCSGEPAAGRSANRSTATPGTPQALSPSDPS
jgi:hypothetical protein